MPIPIDISDIRPARRADPRFIKMLDFATRWMNGPEFSLAEKTKACLHEACHVFYSRRAHFRPEFYGAGVDYFPDRDQFRWHPASIEGLPLGTDVSMAHLMKIFYSPYVICPVLIAGNQEMKLWAGSCDREILRNHFTEKITFDWGEFVQSGAPDNHVALIEGESIRSWYERKSEPGFQRLIEKAHAEIARDLRSPLFRQELWAVSREFELKVF